MGYNIVYVAKAEAELDKLYDDIAVKAGALIAGEYVGGLIDFIEGLIMFPERGTVRDGSIPGLRIIGYRRSVSIAFFVREMEIVILGIFYGGQDISDDILEKRL